ncbi:MAG: hypothetical protein K0R49_123 [Burkholderiales bacterium]|nr:hypothetical protein [Burkholderiales bacterium]
MRTLRLYLNNQLDQSINWTLLEHGNIIESGSSTWDEISGFENVQLEIYLNASCCTIFKTNKTSGIKVKALTDELILGLIEDDLVDDIEDLKPILMQLEDNLAYIAIFNRAFYEQLMHLDKPIKLVQSYVYSTSINEDIGQWTLYLSADQNFLRVSQFQYYLLDDTQPIPELLEDMLLNSGKKPNQILVYSDRALDLNQLQEKFKIKFTLATEPLTFGIPIWNFYNQKSSSFKLKIETGTKKSLIQLFKTLKYFMIMVSILWVINIINIYVNKSKVESELKINLGKISKVDKINPATLNLISEKLTAMAHARSLPDESNFIPMLTRFLKVTGTTEPDDITQLDYSEKDETLIIFLQNFPASQFYNYQDIFKSQHTLATLTDYKTYLKTQKKSKLIDNKSANSQSAETPDQPISNDTKWVVTLRLVWLYQTL